MPLHSPILAGNPRLEQAHAGGPSVKPGPPHDDVDAVRRIQRALVTLGFSLPGSFPNGTNADPDGIYGSETRKAVVAFQQRAFPNAFSEWDGRTGTKTLTEMDRLLPSGGGFVPVQFQVPDARLLLIDQIKKRIVTRANLERNAFGCFDVPRHASRRTVGKGQRVEPTDEAFTQGRVAFKFWRGFNKTPRPSGDQPRFGGEQLAVIFRGAGASKEAASVGTFTRTQQILMTKVRDEGGVSQPQLNQAGLIAWCGIFVLYLYRSHGHLKMSPWISGASLPLRTKQFAKTPEFQKHNLQIEFELVAKGEPLQLADFGLLPGPEQHHVLVVGEPKGGIVLTIEGNSTPTDLRERGAAENPLSTIAARTRSIGEATWFRPLWENVLPAALPTTA